MPFPMVNYPEVPHTWVLVYPVNQRSHVTNITEVKRNLTQFIGGKFNHNFDSIVIGTCTSGIKTLFQITTFNFMGASFDVLDVSMEKKWEFALEMSVTLIKCSFLLLKGFLMAVKMLHVTAPKI